MLYASAGWTMVGVPGVVQVGPYGPGLAWSYLLYTLCAVAPCLAPVLWTESMLTQLKAKATSPGLPNPEGPEDPTS